MIEKILERFYNIDPQEMMTEEQRNVLRYCTEIVQEVAKEYGNGWIPCSERLPEIWEDVLLWCEGCFVCGTHIGEKSQHYGIGYRLPSDTWEVSVLKAWKEDSIKVIAWKPIVPYQKGEN